MHQVLCKQVLHHASNTTPKWFLETVGVHVSLLNGCDYCVEHHFAGLTRLLHDEARSSSIRVALESVVTQSDVFDAVQRRRCDPIGHLPSPNGKGRR